jgi:hypothetical protein
MIALLDADYQIGVEGFTGIPREPLCFPVPTYRVGSAVVAGGRISPAPE